LYCPEGSIRTCGSKTQRCAPVAGSSATMRLKSVHNSSAPPAARWRQDRRRMQTVKHRRADAGDLLRLAGAVGPGDFERRTLSWLICRSCE
jgi:hypothetical protein